MMTTVVSTAVTNLSQEVPGPLKKQRAAHGSIAGDACRTAKKVSGNKDSAGKESRRAFWRRWRSLERSLLLIAPQKGWWEVGKRRRKIFHK